MNELMIHDDRDAIIDGLRQQLRETREELAAERARGGQVERGAHSLRQMLTPLYGALQNIFGEIGAMGVSEAKSISQPRASAAWESWKQKLGGQTAKAIDALLVHGTMNQVQLRIHIGCASGSTPGIVSQLWKAGLINKNGGKISLKDL